MRSYRPDEPFDASGIPVPEFLALSPTGSRHVGGLSDRPLQPRHRRNRLGAAAAVGEHARQGSVPRFTDRVRRARAGIDRPAMVDWS